MGGRTDGWTGGRRDFRNTYVILVFHRNDQQLIKILRNFVECPIHYISPRARWNFFFDEFDGMLRSKHCEVVILRQHSVDIELIVTICAVSIFAHHTWLRNFVFKLHERYWFFRVAGILVPLKCFAYFWI